MRPWSFRRLALTESEVLLMSASACECFASKSFNFRKNSTALLLTDKKTRRLGTCCYRRTVRRERESSLAQTLNNFIQIKAMALGHRKKPVKQVISSGAPRQFHKFLSWFEVDGLIIANLISLFF